MISDLLDILKAIQSAQDSDQKAILERQLKERVEAVLHKFFDDGEAEYPRRKRTFQAIRTHIGIFDENPQGLKEILFAMGAIRSGSDGDDGYWHLPKIGAGLLPGSESVALERKRTPGRRTNWPLIFGALGAVAAIIAILEFTFNLVGAGVLAPLGSTDLATCKAEAGENFEEIVKCENRFGS